MSPNVRRAPAKPWRASITASYAPGASGAVWLAGSKSTRCRVASSSSRPPSTLLSCAASLIGPCSSRKRTMADASAGRRPGTSSSSSSLAVFTRILLGDMCPPSARRRRGVASRRVVRVAALGLITVVIPAQAEHHHRARLHVVNVAATQRLRLALAGRLARVEHGLPADVIAVRGQREAHRPVVGVEHDEERVIHDPPSRDVGLLDAVAGQAQAEAAGDRVGPVVLRHLPAVAPEPREVLDLGALELAAEEELAPTEDGMLAAGVPGGLGGGAVVILSALGRFGLVVKGQGVGRGEATVRGEEVDRRVGAAPATAVEIAGAGEPVAHAARLPLVALDEGAHGVAIHAVPLGPLVREVADLVAAFAEVPRLGDELDL